jgi:hypothetical protein
MGRIAAGDTLPLLIQVAEDADSFGSGLLLPVSSPLARAVALPPSRE